MQALRSPRVMRVAAIRMPLVFICRWYPDVSPPRSGLAGLPEKLWSSRSARSGLGRSVEGTPCDRRLGRRARIAHWTRSSHGLGHSRPATPAPLRRRPGRTTRGFDQHGCWRLSEQPRYVLVVARHVIRRFGRGPCVLGLTRDPAVAGDGFPFDVRLLQLEQLRLDAPITFLAGDSRGGKSTIVEAIAKAIGFADEGGARAIGRAAGRTAGHLQAESSSRSPRTTAERLLPARRASSASPPSSIAVGSSRRTCPLATERPGADWNGRGGGRVCPPPPARP